MERGSRPDLAFPVHQCTKYSSNPGRAHGKAIRRIAKYLCADRDKGTITKPNLDKGVELYVDADFTGA